MNESKDNPVPATCGPISEKGGDASCPSMTTSPGSGAAPESNPPAAAHICQGCEGLREVAESVVYNWHKGWSAIKPLAEALAAPCQSSGKTDVDDVVEYAELKARAIIAERECAAAKSVADNALRDLAKAKSPGWISLDQRKPTAEDADEIGNIMLRNDRDSWDEHWTGYVYKKATHWLPLPKFTPEPDPDEAAFEKAISECFNVPDLFRTHSAELRKFWTAARQKETK